MSNEELVHIYVLPTEEGLPPRALVWPESMQTDPGKIPLDASVLVWTADVGGWTMQGTPVPSELGDAITQHAKDLGVEWD
jgi:hypothetical protein